MMFFSLILLASTCIVMGAAGRKVDDIVGEWQGPPGNTPTSPSQFVADGPFSGNGDLGFVVGVPNKTKSDIAFFYDLTQFHVPSASTGQSVCGYNNQAGHVGVGWLSLDILDFPPDPNASFSAWQHINYSDVSTRTSFSLDSKTLHTTSTVMATQNLVVHKIWYEGPPLTNVTVMVSSHVHNDGQIMDCRLNRAGQEQVDWMWVGSKLGRGFQNKNGLPSHIDRHPLIQRQEEVFVGTHFGGAFHLVSNGTDDNGYQGTEVYKVVNLSAGAKPLVLSSQLWTSRDFNFTRSAFDAVRQSMQSVADEAHLAKVRAEHNTYWDSYWSKSNLSLPNSPSVERFWYGALYLWACTERVNWTAHMPPAGLWKNHYTSNVGHWPAFTTDINTEAPYFGCYSSNHIEVPSAMYQLNLDFIPAGRMLSQYAFNCPGVLHPVEIGARGAIMIMTDQGIRSNALLASMNFMWHYRYTKDLQWLKDVGYTFLSEVAAFWSCYLVKDPQSGVYHDLNDCCYEICGANDYPKTKGTVPDNNFEMQNNPANSLGMLRTLYSFMLQASRDLGVDEALRVKWQDILDHLAPLPTAVWENTATSQNLTVLADFENAGLPPLSDMQMLSAIQPIYPADQFSISMPNRTLFQIARNTLEYLRWFGSSFPPGADGSCIMYTIGCRLGLNASDVFWQFLQPSPGYVPLLANLMTTAQIGPAAVQFVNELFVMSHEPFVRLFHGFFSSYNEQAPIPTKNNTDYYRVYMERRPWLGATFQKLRAQGAFLISASMGVDGDIHNVTVESEKGLDFTWLDVFPETKIDPLVYAVETTGHIQVPVHQVNYTSSVAVVEGRVFRFATSPYTKYMICKGASKSVWI